MERGGTEGRGVTKEEQNRRCQEGVTEVQEIGGTMTGGTMTGGTGTRMLIGAEAVEMVGMVGEAITTGDRTSRRELTGGERLSQKLKDWRKVGLVRKKLKTRTRDVEEN